MQQILTDDALDIVLNELQEFEPLPAEKLEGAKARLRLLYLSATVDQTYASRKVRTALNKATKEISTKLNELQMALKYSAPNVAEPLRLAAVDLYLDEKLRKTGQEQRPKAPLVIPSSIIEELQELIAKLTPVLAHLKHLAKDYDSRERTSDALLEWIKRDSQVHGDVRAELSTYLKKGHQEVSPATFIFKSIAALYQYLFGRDIPIKAVSSVKVDERIGAEYLKAEGSAKPAVDKYSGPGIDFALTIIDHLGLSGCFVKHQKDAFEQNAFNRGRALNGPYVDRTELVNRIGHVWKN